MATAPILFDEENHLYSRGGISSESVTTVIARAGWCDFSHVDENIRIHSMKRGKSVHWMTALEDQGALNYRRVPVALRGYRKAYLAWKKASGFVPELIEYRFISDFGFAGTFDRYGYFPATEMYLTPTWAIIDIKTGAVADWVRLQTAAYALGVEPRFALARMIRRIGLELRANGTYGVKEFPLATFDQDAAQFMKAVKREGV